VRGAQVGRLHLDGLALVKQAVGLFNQAKDFAAVLAEQGIDLLIGDQG